MAVSSPYQNNVEIKLEEHPSSYIKNKETWRAKFSRNKTMIENQHYLTTVILDIYKFLGLIAFECVVTFKAENNAKWFSTLFLKKSSLHSSSSVLIRASPAFWLELGVFLFVWEMALCTT